MCEHENFKASVSVGRLSQEEGGPITHYTADIHVECAQCGEPFEFLGVPMGVTAYGPAVSVDGQDLRAAIKPKNGPAPPPGLPGFGVRLTQATREGRMQ